MQKEESRCYRGEAYKDPESTAPVFSQQKLPWFACASLTACLVALCYALSDDSNISGLDQHQNRHSDDSLNDVLENDNNENTSSNHSSILNVITIIISLFSIVVIWSAKNTDQAVKDN